MTLGALVASIILGAGSLAWGFIGMGIGSLARSIAAFAGLWVVAVWRRWRWFSYVGLAVYFLCAALGLWFLDFPPGWMFAGAIFGLLAWDLTDFRHRQRFAANAAERRSVELRHMLGLSTVAILGITLSSLAMLIRLQFSFEWTVFIVIVLALAASQIFSWIRNRG